ncbi:hypothetical protein [Nostoc piscinale]|uniref:hypothetical protein n=1 Tax=Nostoc piscinale TaxID=224012 RepID=UPI001F20A55C|nr:hypothetical protein [Nostoc piscinale]
MWGVKDFKTQTAFVLVDFLTRFGYHSRNAIASNYHRLNYEYNSTYTTNSAALQAG